MVLTLCLPNLISHQELNGIAIRANTCTLLTQFTGIILCVEITSATTQTHMPINPYQKTQKKLNFTENYWPCLEDMEGASAKKIIDQGGVRFMKKNKGIAEMNPNEINIAIAEACGWIPTTKRGWGFSDYMDFPAHQKDGTIVFDSQLPNYCHDLNAMHEAIKSHAMSDCDFVFRLAKIVGANMEERSYVDIAKMVNATSLQRAEAFLRAIGKWKE